MPETTTRCTMLIISNLMFYQSICGTYHSTNAAGFLHTKHLPIDAYVIFRTYQMGGPITNSRAFGLKSNFKKVHSISKLRRT